MQHQLKCFLVIIMLFPLANFAQEIDTNRIEIRTRLNDEQPLVIPAGKSGLVVLQKDRDASEGIINLIHYDTAFKKQWEQPLAYYKRLKMVSCKTFGNKVYALFNNAGEEILEVLVADLIDKQVVAYQFPYFERFEIKDFCIRKGDLYVAGLLRKLPAAARINFKETTIASLPMAVDGKNIEIGEIFVAKNGKVSVTISFEQRKNKEVLIKEFSEDNTSDDLLISPSEEYDLINGKVTQLGAKSKIVIGTYGYRNNESTQGFYIGGFYNNQEVYKKYHSFNDLANFYTFKSEREQEKIEERIERKKSQGKEYRSKYRLLTHEVVPAGNNYLMLGEAYYPTYRQERVRRYTSRGYYYENQIVFDGYKYTHAVVVCFDKKGDIVWDHGFKINDVKSMELKEHVRVSSLDETVKCIYNLEGNMNVISIKNGEIVSTKSDIELPSKYEEDKVKFSDLGQSEFWYGNHYLAWGYQRIKNLGESAGNKNRNVFYINKLSF